MYGNPLSALPRALPAGLLAALCACQGAPAPAPAPTAAPAPDLQPVPALDRSVVTLPADSAARLAQEARQEVTAQVAPGLELSLWAPEQLIADPIGISIDSLGRVFVTRTARTNRSEIDIRGHRDWMMRSIAFNDVEDKRKFYLSELAPARSAQNTWLEDYNGDGSHDWRDLTVHKERVYRLEDRDGDGRADFSQLILEDFNDVISDVAHGILAVNDDLYLTISPDIWRLRDADGDGVIDSKESLAHGSGVHIGFGGHGLSGPIIGPDGRLWWKQGDLGVNLTTRDGRRLVNPNSGVILRAEPDGTDAEIFATGLRNPQEFAFDEYGNLVSVDNDGDHPGETERVVYITDGSDSGWRINWQFGKYQVDPDNNDYKVWMDEGLYKPRFAGQAAYITPPVAAYHAGPSGMAYNPGTALGDRWKGYFFESVFTGSPATSKVQAFKLRGEGAGFALADDTTLVSGVLVTGMKFGPDGALYLNDWVQGWNPKDRGRIWKLDAPGAASSPLRAETRALIAASFHGRPMPELVGFLRHPDMRVRTKAQFELVDRGAASELLAVARQRDHQLARIHALWGIGQLARRDARQARPLADFLRDADPEIRAQAAKLIGDVRYAPAAAALVPLLKDTAPRARFFAAEALGRLQYRPAVPAMIQMLADNDDRDVYLRHAGALALARIGDAAPVIALADHPSRGARLAAVVALRRMRDPGVARFLGDADETVVTEAARAINDDRGIEGALPELAALLAQPRFTNEALTRRVINANLRVGSAETAQRVAAYAARSGASDSMRVEAIGTLAVWPKPSVLDRVDGIYRGAVQRDTSIARAALAAIVEPVFAGGSPAVQVALADAVARLRYQEVAPTLFAKVRSGPTPEVRIAALRALQALGDRRTEEAVRVALQDPEATVRMAGLGLIPPLGLPEATTTELLASVLGRGTVAEQQTALSSLGRLQGTTSRELLTRLVNQLSEGKVAPEIQLDVIEAARAANHAPLTERVERFEQGRANAAPLVAFADALHGGNAREGQRISFTHPAAECTRCHAFGGRGGNVGPDLRGVASRLSREMLLQELVAPSLRIAPGWGTVVLTLRNGQRVAGTLREETPSEVVVQPGGGEPRRVAKTDIAQRVNAPSPMPPMGALLTRRELRDVVEFLSTLK